MEFLEEMEYVGDIPEGWKWMKVEDFAEVVSGGTPRTDKPEFWNGDIAWITPKDLSNFKFRYIERGERNISREGLENSNAKLLPKGAVLLSSRAPVGYLAIAKNELSTNQGFQSLIPKENVVSEFLYYLLKNNVEYLKSQASGTTFGELSKSTLKKLTFPLPPLPEQKAIAKVLSSIDDKIELLHRQNKTLEEMAMTLFRQWFIEPTKDGLPDGWEEVSLGDVFDYLEGPGIRNWQYSTKGIPFLNIRLIENEEINIKNANFISEEEAFGKYKKFLLQEGDVVISTSGTLGKYAIVRKYHLPLLLNTSIIRFRPKNKNYRIFMYLYLKSREFKEYLESSADGSVQANFGPTHLRMIKIVIPPNHILEKFENAVSPFYEKLNNNYSQIQTLEKLRDTLLPKLMSGEIRVRI